PRSSLLALFREAAGARVGGGSRVRGRAQADGRVVQPQRMVVGADSLRRVPRVLRAPLREGAQGLSGTVEEMGSAPRGRHAPPPEVRLPIQRQRLLISAAAEFAERGYANASSESI